MDIYEKVPTDLQGVMDKYLLHFCETHRGMKWWFEFPFYDIQFFESDTHRGFHFDDSIENHHYINEGIDRLVGGYDYGECTRCRINMFYEEKTRFLFPDVIALRIVMLTPIEIIPETVTSDCDEYMGYRVMRIFNERQFYTGSYYVLLLTMEEEVSWEDD